MEHEEIVKRDVKILINYDGSLKYSVPNKMFVPTIYNLKDYPFDNQILKFRLGSWSHTHDQLEIKIKNESNPIDVNLLKAPIEFKVINVTGELIIVK